MLLNWWEQGDAITRRSPTIIDNRHYHHGSCNPRDRVEALTDGSLGPLAHPMARLRYSADETPLPTPASTTETPAITAIHSLATAPTAPAATNTPNAATSHQFLHANERLADPRRGDVECRIHQWALPTHVAWTANDRRFDPVARGKLPAQRGRVPRAPRRCRLDQGG